MNRYLIETRNFFLPTTLKSSIPRKNMSNQHLIGDRTIFPLSIPSLTTPKSSVQHRIDPKVLKLKMNALYQLNKNISQKTKRR
jgi:hypothetical protein